MIITSDGFIGIGTNSPTCLLEVAVGTSTTNATLKTYYKYNSAIVSDGTAQAFVCAKFNSSIWLAGANTTAMYVSSDIRIKEDIQDINDDSALQMILAIEPKTYKYIDKIEGGNIKVYGFIAQQIKQVIPEATSIQTSYIPNIMLLADYNNNIITLPSQPTKVIIKKNDIIKCYGSDDTIIIINVIDIIDELTFKISELKYTENKIFIYGTEVNDFLTLDKAYIFTLNVCATQELHRRIENQNVIIKSQNDRIIELEDKITRILNYINI